MVTVAQMGIAVIKDLKKLHDMGYIHGDIKPDNILINYRLTQNESIKVDKFEESENPKLIDFGATSKYLDE